MATRFEAFLEGDDPEHLDAVGACIVEEFRRLEGLLSRFDPTSEIARINREAAGRAVLIDVEVRDLLLACREYHRMTDSWFDVTATAASPGMDGVLLDADRRTVRFAHPGTAIDLGGVAKGYALDCAGDICRRYGVAGLLHGGTSSVLAVGRPQDSADWPIAVRDPDGEGPPVTRIGLADQSFSCSAVVHPDQETSDVIDPRTGQAIAGQAACVVIAPTASLAEVLSTALLAMGRESAGSYLSKHDLPGVSVGWVERRDWRWLRPREGTS